jgi:tRNA(Ile)-lysidine synthetase-like protein
MSCIEKVRDYIRARGMIAPGTRVLIAVSGGADSMALMTILSELSAEMGIEIAAAHFDHGIRPEAGRERALVQRAAGKLEIPLFFGSGSVPAEARRTKKGIEETARLLRYRFLEETARAWNAGSIALGHNRDDQVETILHHIIRGSGWRGLRGIPPRRGLFVRPLLACSRSELRAHVRDRHVPYALDRSNLDNRFLRNRIRNRLLPYLERGYNPAAAAALLRLGENLAEGWETLEKPLFKLVPRAGSREEVALRLSKIAKLTDFQLYLLVDLVLRERFGVLQDVERTHFDAAKRLIRSGRSGKAVHFPHGIVARLEHGNLVLSKSARRRGDHRRSRPLSPPLVESLGGGRGREREARRSEGERNGGVLRGNRFSRARQGEEAGRPPRPVRHEGQKEAQRPVYRSKGAALAAGRDPRVRGRPGRILGAGSRGGRADEDRPRNAGGAAHKTFSPFGRKMMSAGGVCDTVPG